MQTNPSRTYSEIGRKLDDYQKIENLVEELGMNLGLAFKSQAWCGRLSDRLKFVLSKTLSERDIDRIGSDLLKLEGE